MADTRSPRLGDIVLFVLPDGPCAGESRPAIVVRESEDAKPNLRLFIDEGNDGGGATPGTGTWQTTVPYDATGKVGRTWRERP